MWYSHSGEWPKSGSKNESALPAVALVFPAQSTRKRCLHPRRASEQAVVTDIFPSPLRYVPSFFIAHIDRYLLRALSISTFFSFWGDRRFAQNFANSRSRAFFGVSMLRYGLERPVIVRIYLRSFGWVSYDKVGVLYSGKLGNRSEAHASDLRSYPGLWWNRINQRLYEGNESEYSPRTCLIGRPAGDTLRPPYNLTSNCKKESFGGFEPTTSPLRAGSINSYAA